MPYDRHCRNGNSVCFSPLQYGSVDLPERHYLLLNLAELFRSWHYNDPISLLSFGPVRVRRVWMLTGPTKALL